VFPDESLLRFETKISGPPGHAVVVGVRHVAEFDAPFWLAEYPTNTYGPRTSSMTECQADMSAMNVEDSWFESAWAMPLPSAVKHADSAASVWLVEAEEGVGDQFAYAAGALERKAAIATPSPAARAPAPDARTAT
jgi:hypothetical protein